VAVTTQGFCDGKCSSAYQFGPTDLEWEEYIWVYPSSPLIKIRSDSWDHEQRCSWNPLWDKMLWLLRFGPMHGVVSGEAFPLHQDYSVRWLHSGGWVGWGLAWLAQQCWSIQACTPLRNPVTWSYSRHDRKGPIPTVKNLSGWVIRSVLDQKICDMPCQSPTMTAMTTLAAVNQLRHSTYHSKGLLLLKVRSLLFVVPCVLSSTRWVRRRLSDREVCRWKW